MGEFSWEDIDSSAYMSASGPTGSVQFRAGDEDSQSKISGSSRLTYNTSSNFLEFQGDLNVTGNVHADGAGITLRNKCGKIARACHYVVRSAFLEHVSTDAESCSFNAVVTTIREDVEP